MALFISHMAMVLLTISMHCICQFAFSVDAQSSYSSGSLVCKTYSMTKMDCSNRSLPALPFLDQNLTTSLDLSHNQLKNVTNAPFENLQVLLTLDMSYNEISWMSSTAFRGLWTLERLNVERNKLVDLPKDIFCDLHNLLYLNLNDNWFTAIPGKVLAQLHSLQYLSFINWKREIPKMNLEGFEYMKNLNQLRIFIVIPFETQVYSDTLHQLRDLPLRVFTCVWFWEIGSPTISKDVFASLPSNITHIQTSFALLPAIPLLQCPCQYLYLSHDVSAPQVVDINSLQVLQKWNKSLEILYLRLGSLERIEDHTFIWIPNLLTLNLQKNDISYLAKYAFYGLNSLQQLILSDNLLTYVPSDALNYSESQNYCNTLILA